MLLTLPVGSFFRCSPGQSAVALTSPDKNSPGKRSWLTLPDTPELPVGDHATVKLNNTPIFFSRFGKGPHVLLLHGGMANSNYWGHQVAALAGNFAVTVMDTRGHGRSPITSNALSYSQFASDAVELLKYLGIQKSAVVGWSDGAITGVQLALTRPDLLSGLFAFGGNTNLQGLKPGGARAATFQLFSARCRKEYLSLSPHPEKWSVLQHGLSAMWHSQPSFSSRQLSGIALPVTIADGEYDEIIKPEHNREMAASIRKARLSIMSGVSHFAMLQDPSQFNARLNEFLSSLTL